MALTPLLLVALEYLRRAPQSWLRAALTLIVAFQLSLTVYTMWVFWVLPTLLLSVWLVPRHCADASGGRAARVATITMLIGMLCFMTVYTAERYTALFSAATYGEQFAGLAEAADWLARCSRDFFVFPVLCGALGLVGLFAVWRTPQRWWCWLIGAGVLAPVALTFANGSPGYARNLSYLVPVVALLVGAGVVAMLRPLERSLSSLVPGVAMAVVALFACTYAYCDVNAQATRILQPDWGTIAQRYERMPELYGRRWLCPCLANHWQIDWYARNKRPQSLLNASMGGTIEVVMGAQFDRQGPVVFRHDPVQGGIRPEPLPTYLLATPSTEISGGIALRRWVGRRVVPGDLELAPRAEPAFLAVRINTASSRSTWTRSPKALCRRSSSRTQRPATPSTH